MWNEFKDCPFCGGRPIVKCYPTISIVKCEPCKIGMGAHGPEHDDQVINGIIWREELERKWNSRTDKSESSQ